MFSLPVLEEALRLVHRTFPGTPQYAWPLLAQRIGAEVWVKHENHTPTGAFKVRGGLVYLDRLQRSQPAARGVISATRGNHGQSISFAAARAGTNRSEAHAVAGSNGSAGAPHGGGFEQAELRIRTSG